jgi:5-methylcytosine-specific restriction endonuclease McrA
MALSVYARRKVWARDKGVCAGCGCDTGLMERIARRLRYPLEDKAAFELLLRAWGLKVYVWAWVVPNLWEADHVVPLAEGGTHALENYRTLCVPCHKAETKALAGRRAAQRRQHRAPELPL